MEQQSLQHESLRTEAAYLPKPSGSQQEAVAADLPSPTDASAALSQNTAELEALARSLWPRNPVRKLAIEVLSGQPLPTIQPLLDALAKPSPYRWKQYATAAGTVAHAALTAEQKAEVVAALHKLLQGNRRQRRRAERRATALRITMAVIAGFILAMVVTLNELQVAGYSISDNVEAVLGIPVLFSLFITFPLLSICCAIDADRLRRVNKMRAAAAMALGRLAAPESVPVLADTLEDTGSSVRKAALRALLPLLTSEHYGQLGSCLVPSLCRALRTADEPLALELLNALEKVGDGRAIPSVERILGRHVSAKVEEAASRLLPLLQQRKAEENAPRVLLRASTSTQSASPDVLLRPAQASQPADPQQLLRAPLSDEAP